MRQKHLFLCVIFISGLCLSAFSQVSNSYTYSVKFVSKGKMLINDICVLNIGKTSSFFYSQGQLDESRELEAMITKSSRTHELLGTALRGHTTPLPF